MGEHDVIAHKLESLEKSMKSGSENFREIYQRLGILERAKDVTEYQYAEIKKLLEEMKSDISDLKDKPRKKYDMIIGVLVTGIIMSFIGYFAAKLLI